MEGDLRLHVKIWFCPITYDCLADRCFSFRRNFGDLCNALAGDPVEAVLCLTSCDKSHSPGRHLRRPSPNPLQRRPWHSDVEVVVSVWGWPVRNPLVFDVRLGEDETAHLVPRAAHGVQTRLPELLDGGEIDLPAAEARTHTPHLVEGQAGELAAVAEGDERGEKDDEEDVAAATGPVVAADGAVPAGVRRP